MVYGIGTDVVSKARIADMMDRHADSFMERFLHAAERTVVLDQKNERQRTSKVAKLFAAKEAFSKAMGVGFRGHVHWHEIEITHTELGQPLIQLHGKTLDFFNEKVGQNGSIALSLSDEKELTLAFVVIDIK